MKPQTGTCDVEAFRDLPRGVRLLGLDLGTKTIGLALSDVERRIATPPETIKRTKVTADAERPQANVARLPGAGGGVGPPPQLDGAEGARGEAPPPLLRPPPPDPRPPAAL